MVVDVAACPVEPALTDVLVIGGGPAGSTLATLLREKDRRVVLIEKDYHPRFHIGESLLPMNLPILERLGVLEQVRAMGVPKWGADFAGDDDSGGRSIRFADALDKGHPYAYQVRRAEFDQLLIDNAARRGVEVHQGTRVSAVERQGDGRFRVTARGPDGQTLEWRARFLADASGRDTFLARNWNLKAKNPRHQSAAVFGHFRGVSRAEGQAGGHIGIYWFRHGWFWVIPLQNDVTSVGAVCWPSYLKTRRGNLADFLAATVELCPPVARRMQGATACDEIRATGNYSYRSRQMVGDGWLLVGDAYAFVDPVFSTGVFFAMNGACLAAEGVDAWLDDPARAAPLLRGYQRQVRRGIRTVSWFIYRFTSPTMRHLFIHSRNVFRVEEAIISVLAGDVFRDTPIGPRLALFKGIYRLVSLSHWSAAWRAWRERRRQPREAFRGGTTSQDPM